jgi:alkyldihydroxyacetonephosphate synthase
MKRWNGWGDDRTQFPLPDIAKDYLVSLIGEGTKQTDATLDDVLKSVPESRLPDNSLVTFDPEERLRHACGQSLPDWIALRSGRIPRFPDGVIYPKSDGDIREAINYAYEHKLILIPFGGGTSVVRHINPPKGEVPVATIDLSQLNHLLNLDETSQLATFQAGIRGPDIENQLNKFGYTLGHFPQSFELSTLGGWIATRSSGQQSYYYGRIEDLFKGGHIEAPRGPVELQPFPASAAGQDLKQLFLGSEGRLGFITRAIVAIHPIPEFERFYGVLFRDWENGLRAVRELAQKKLQLSMMRLSDPQETETTLILSGKRNLIRWAEFGFNALGYRHERCLLILGVTGGRNQAVQSKKIAFHIIRKYGGFNSGTFIGKAWKTTRFLSPYLRNSLWESGYALDTLETASSWENVQLTKDSIINAIINTANNLDERILVFGHLSHLYRSGASIYITFIFRRSADPDENLHQWREIKHAASQAIINSGGTISHHHGIGKDHSPYLKWEKGQIGLEMIENMGKFFDPLGLMNPGVMFD